MASRHRVRPQHYEDEVDDDDDTYGRSYEDEPASPSNSRFMFKRDSHGAPSLGQYFQPTSSSVETKEADATAIRKVPLAPPPGYSRLPIEEEVGCMLPECKERKKVVIDAQGLDRQSPIIQCTESQLLQRCSKECQDSFLLSQCPVSQILSPSLSQLAASQTISPSLSQLVKTVPETSSPSLSQLASKTTSPSLSQLASETTSPSLSQLASKTTSPSLSQLASETTSPSLSQLASKTTSPSLLQCPMPETQPVSSLTSRFPKLQPSGDLSLSDIVHLHMTSSQTKSSHVAVESSAMAPEACPLSLEQLVYQHSRVTGRNADLCEVETAPLSSTRHPTGPEQMSFAELDHRSGCEKLFRKVMCSRLHRHSREHRPSCDFVSIWSSSVRGQLFDFSTPSPDDVTQC